MRRLFKLMLVTATLVAANSVYGEPGGGPGRDRGRGGMAGKQLEGYYLITPGRSGDRHRFNFGPGGPGGPGGRDGDRDRDRDRRPEFERMVISDVDYQEGEGIATFYATHEKKIRGFGRPGNDDKSVTCKGAGSWSVRSRVVVISEFCPAEDRNDRSILVNYALKLDFRGDWRDNDEREVVLNGDEESRTIDVSRDDVEINRGFPAKDVLLKRVARLRDDWRRDKPWEGHPGAGNGPGGDRPGNGGDRPGPGGDRPGNGGGRPGGDRPGPGGNGPGPGPRPK